MCRRLYLKSAKIAESFLDWLDKTDHPWKFEESRRRSFLMSVWLHDVGKLAVPLEIMDKESKLGAQMKTIEERFVKISLLDEIAAYRGEITAEEKEVRKKERDIALDEIRRINRAEFVPDEKLELLKKIIGEKYRDESGEEIPHHGGIHRQMRSRLNKHFQTAHHARPHGMRLYDHDLR